MIQNKNLSSTKKISVWILMCSIPILKRLGDKSDGCKGSNTAFVVVVNNLSIYKCIAVVTKWMHGPMYFAGIMTDYANELVRFLMN